MRAPTTSFLLSIERNRVMVRYDGTSGGKITRPIKDENDYYQFLYSKADEANVQLEELRVLCSSSLDFPEEHTRNEATLKLAATIRMRCPPNRLRIAAMRGRLRAKGVSNA
jgi:hypothetical protein